MRKVMPFSRIDPDLEPLGNAFTGRDDLLTLLDRSRYRIGCREQMSRFVVNFGLLNANLSKGGLLSALLAQEVGRTLRAGGER